MSEEKKVTISLRVPGSLNEELNKQVSKSDFIINAIRAQLSPQPITTQTEPQRPQTESVSESEQEIYDCLFGYAERCEPKSRDNSLNAETLLKFACSHCEVFVNHKVQAMLNAKITVERRLYEPRQVGRFEAVPAVEYREPEPPKREIDQNIDWSQRVRETDNYQLWLKSRGSQK